jgi:hypothetical protein
MGSGMACCSKASSTEPAASGYRLLTLAHVVGAPQPFPPQPESAIAGGHAGDFFGEVPGGGVLTREARHPRLG